ncbi:MAG: NIPSNAP family protein [Bryobacteraceae bacterium]
MDRRSFINSSLAASTAALEAAQGPGSGAAASGGQREYYELRRYQLRSGPEPKLVEKYMAESFIPALNRIGLKPVGAFTVTLGPQTPALYVLIPSTSLDLLTSAESRLSGDEEYMRTGSAFLSAPAKEPAYERLESSLMIAFEGWPKLVVPPVTAQKGKRIYQLRTYESPSYKAHRNKVKMFHSGEFEIFHRAGFWQVFYGETLIGSRLPNSTYMLSYPDLGELNAKWDAFFSDPQWKKLAASPEFNYEATVSNVTNLILAPASYSQI